MKMRKNFKPFKSSINKLSIFCSHGEKISAGTFYVYKIRRPTNDGTRFSHRKDENGILTYLSLIPIVRMRVPSDSIRLALVETLFGSLPRLKGYS
jgi:hypothetical protein